MAKQKSKIRVQRVLFENSSVDGYLSGFPVSALWTMLPWIFTYKLLFERFSSLGHRSRSRTANQVVSLGLPFGGSVKPLSTVSEPFYIPPPRQVWGVPFLHILITLVIFQLFKNCSCRGRCEVASLVILMLISLMPSDAEHLELNSVGICKGRAMDLWRESSPTTTTCVDQSWFTSAKPLSPFAPQFPGTTGS